MRIKFFFLKDKRLHEITNLNENSPLYFLVVCTKDEVDMLEQEGFLTKNAYHIDGQLLCIPLDDLGTEHEIALYKRVRQLNSESIEIAPLGTAEQYAILYDLPVYSYDRSE